MSVKVPVDEWLCRKMEKLNITVQEGYPSHTSETAGLARDQFVKPPKKLKWYVMHCEKKDFSCSKVHTWTNEPARMNSAFPRIAQISIFSSCLQTRITGHFKKSGSELHVTSPTCAIRLQLLAGASQEFRTICLHNLRLYRVSRGKISHQG